MTEPIYYKAERFYPDKKYEDFSKIFNRAEIVSYDVGLTVSNATKFIGEVSDWKLLLQTPLEPDEQIIAYYKNPTESHEFHILDDGFVFCGYDLSEELTEISAITNCGGGFEAAIPYSELNTFGLLAEYDKAFLVRDLLNELYPGEEHAYCEVYELWRRL